MSQRYRGHSWNHCFGTGTPQNCPRFFICHFCDRADVCTLFAHCSCALRGDLAQYSLRVGKRVIDGSLSWSRDILAMELQGSAVLAVATLATTRQ